MPRKSHDRHLAKNAERRRQQRSHAKRSKQAALGVGGVIAAVLLILVGIGILTRNSDQQAGETPTPSVSTPGGSSGPTQTGTDKPQQSPATKVACGAEVPAAASDPKPQFDRAPTPDEVLKKDTAYTAVVQTSCGTITIDLDASASPQTVANFVFLAEQGYYDGQFVTRVVDSIDVVQAGGSTATGGPGYTIPDELTGKEHYATGTVAMANGGPSTGGSQFFLITGPEGANLDGNPNYTIFGQITDGLDVAKQINALMPVADGSYDGPPTETVYIEKVTIERKKAPAPSPTPSG